MPIIIRGAYLLLVPQGWGAHSKWALSMGTGRLFLFEGRQNEKQSFDAYFTKDQKDLKTGLSLAQLFL